MCTVPPPPPLPTLPEKPASSIELEEITDTFPDDLCQWAANHPELREACIKNNICLYQPPFKYQYKHFKSIKQEGPTCGLVALSMLINGAVPPTEILSIAKNEGYTNRGEMFSCKNLLKLAKKVTCLADIEDIKFSAQIGELNSETVISKLLDGSQILVPYDADSNDYPCLKGGHKAHWAILCGVIVVENPVNCKSTSKNVHALCKHGKSKYLMVWNLEELSKSNGNLNEFPQKVVENGQIYDADFNHYPCSKLGHNAHWALVCGIMVPVDSLSGQVYVLAKHGKSKYLSIWRLDALDQSNRNLVEFSPKRDDDGAIYILPTNGVGGENGLRGQFIIVDRLNKYSHI